MGACPLLCRRDDFELGILLHLAYRFLNPDYCVFDCCGMALREALLGQQIAIDLMVAVLKKDRLPSIPTLRYVVWKPATTMRASRVMVQVNMEQYLGE